MKKTTVAVLIGGLSLGVNAAGFDVVTLGSKGGIQDGNLTAFMLSSELDDNYVLLDAGSVVNGLIVANDKGVFDQLTVPEESKLTKVGYVLKEKIKGYFISHAHLDHVAGMIISSPEDSNKPIYALSSVNERLMNNYFNWSALPNFGNEGNGFKLGKYTYTDLDEPVWHPVTGTSLKVKALPLAHSGTESTAFLFQDKDGDAFVYFGDTGPDAVEKSDALKNVWTALAPLVKNGQLKGIIIEVSFPNGTPDKQLYGHLTPDWLIKELTALETLNGKGSLKGLNVMISHIKYGLEKGESQTAIIKRQLDAANTLGVNFSIPEQGDAISL